ncbi:MAG: MaoC/PaaZ C-terminal domain-containing protein [Thermodesulfobacteriota bacterium]|nr:MaoC/PaaZ C-terminal domain-containing protein [Thermodesulfobacteriota bacterium]
MEKKLYYEDVEVDSDIPSLVKNPTKRQLVRWAVASGDLNELHYDKDHAVKLGFPDVILHGRLKAAFLGQLMTEWIGDGGRLKKLACNYRGNDFPDDEIICKGRIINKYVQGSDHMVECEIWTEDKKGNKTTPGTAIVVLPSKTQM